MTDTLRTTTFLCFLSMLSMLVVAPALTAQVRVLNLREMTKAAGSIFVGTVTQAQGATDDGDIVTYTTFNVEQVLYGGLPEGITIKQLGGESRGMGMRLEHMRYFRKGERVLVMLYPASSLGFTSPVGLDQGVWSVTPDGRVTGVSAEALRGLEPMLRGYGIKVQESQAIGLQAFTGIIGALLREVGKR